LQKPLPKSKAAIIAKHKRAWRIAVQEQLLCSPRFEKVKVIDPSFPNTEKVILTSVKILCKCTSLLVQLHTGHCLLSAYIHQIQKANSSTCTACDKAAKTVYHYLLDCRVHSKHRCNMHNAVHPGPKALSILLSDPNAIDTLFMYIHATRRFERSYGDLTITWRWTMPNREPRQL
ncbi:hypothetical protein J132_02868, partial [Termitomyces sp. J132]